MSQFTENDWKQVLNHLTDALGPDAQKYATVPSAKLVAAIPYLAGSEDPDRFAVSNLMTFHAASKARKLFGHRSSDDADVMRRLATFHVGSQSNPKIVDYGLTLLSLISLSDHEHDAAEDKKAGKYNPINAGTWNAAKLRQELESQLAKNPSAREAFASVVSSEHLLGVW